MPEYIPFDLKDMVWDIQVSRWYRRKAELDADGKQKMDVTLIVAKKR